MRSIAMVVLMGCGATVSLAQGPSALEEEAARNGWLFSLAAGQQRARETGKPLLVVLRCAP